MVNKESCPPRLMSLAALRQCDSQLVTVMMLTVKGHGLWEATAEGRSEGLNLL